MAKFKEGELLKDVRMPRIGEKSKWLEDLEAKQAEQAKQAAALLANIELVVEGPPIELSLVPDEVPLVPQSNVIKFQDRSKIAK